MREADSDVCDPLPEDLARVLRVDSILLVSMVLLALVPTAVLYLGVPAGPWAMGAWFAPVILIALLPAALLLGVAWLVAAAARPSAGTGSRAGMSLALALAYGALMLMALEILVMVCLVAIRLLG